MNFSSPRLPIFVPLKVALILLLLLLLLGVCFPIKNDYTTFESTSGNRSSGDVVEPRMRARVSEQRRRGPALSFSQASPDLSLSTNEINLKKEFSNFGEVAEVKLVKDESGKRSKGYAFIQYTSQDDAMLALENLDCRYIDGRTVFLELAKPTRKQFGRYPSASGPPPTMLQDSS